MICAMGMIFVTAVSAHTATSRPGAQISYERAEEIALAKVGGGTVREIELDRERGVLVYDAEIKYNGVKYEVDIDAITGEIVKFKQRGSSRSAAPTAPPPAQAESQSNSSSGQISRERAEEIALAEVGGGTVREIELDRKKGRLAYEVEVKYDGWEYEVDIDAATGEIIKFEVDD